MKKTCVNFINALKKINSENIFTQSALMANQTLYNSFWFATGEFVKYALSSKTSGKNDKGEPLPGNIYKVERLEKLGATTAEDIKNDCVIKIISKLDLVLKQPLKKQKNYCYRIVNNMVNDCYRALPPEDIELIYLNEVVKSQRVNKEDACTYEDLIGDTTYNGEAMFFERETIKDLTKKLKTKKVRELTEKKVKQARDLAEKKKVILSEISMLSTRPTEVFVRLSKHLGIKTGNLAARIINDGYENTFAQLIIDIATKYCIDLEDIRNIISVSKLTEESYKKDKGLVRLLSRDPKVVADQISKYANRAKGRLDK